jgi:hypothetical protein
MQAITNKSLQNQAIPAQQKKAGRNERPAGANAPRRAESTVLPENAVNQDSATKKRPSIPVTPAEKMALRENFSIYA